MTYARLATRGVPTLIISGGADGDSRSALMRIMAAPIPGHKWASIPEAGHAAFWEEPDNWNRLALESLGDK